MKRAAWLLLLVGAALAIAADCFDFAAWRQAVVNGESALAQQVIDRAVATCACGSETNDCLALPGTTVLVSPRFLREAAGRFADWTAQITAACGPLPEASEDERKAKTACYDQRAAQFAEGLRGERDSAVLATLPQAIAERLTRGWRVAGSTPETTPVSLRERFGAEMATTAEQICSLSRKLIETEQLLDNVRRRGGAAPNEKLRRERELEKAVKFLREQIEALKRKFEHGTNELWDPLKFCSGT